MRVETDGRNLNVVSSSPELLETLGLGLLLVVPFLLAGSLFGLALVAAIIFTAVVIHSALQAWNDDPATNIRYRYDGTTTVNTGFQDFDGNNVILFADDPNFRNVWRGLEKLFTNALLLASVYVMIAAAR